MPVIYKIIVFLLLQQGTKVMEKIGNANSVRMESNAIAGDMTLSLEGGQDVVEQMIIVCTIYDSKCEVTYESASKTTIVFKNLKYTYRNRIMERSRTIHDRLQIQWEENPVVKL